MLIYVTFDLIQASRDFCQYSGKKKKLNDVVIYSSVLLIRMYLTSFTLSNSKERNSKFNSFE